MIQMKDTIIGICWKTCHCLSTAGLLIITVVLMKAKDHSRTTSTVNSRVWYCDAAQYTHCSPVKWQHPGLCLLRL